MYLGGSRLCGMLRVEYAASRLVEQAREFNRRLGPTIKAWVRVIPADSTKSGEMTITLHWDSYMDLHVLEPACAIGLHRHRDNQEIFLMLDGDGIMVIGDWADSGTRTRSFDVRPLTAGSLAMLRGGNLHGLANPTDRRASWFMFGGYD